MTSFTAVSGPLDDVVRARELLARAADAMRQLEVRARTAGEEGITSASYRTAAAIGDAHATLLDALETMRGLESLILAREARKPGKGGV